MASANRGVERELTDAVAVMPSTLESRIQDLLPELERVYTDIHAHPELSMLETRTARIAADRLRGAGYDVTRASVTPESSETCATAMAPR